MMVNDITFCRLEQIEEFEEYERKLFISFSRHLPDGWVMKNYKRPEPDRLQALIPYEDQKIFSLKRNDEIIAAISVNYNTEKELQLEALGFSIDKSIRQKIFCEGLILYSSEEMMGEKFLENFMFFGEKLVEEMKKDKVEILLATCPKKLKSMYTLFGFEVTERKTMNDKTVLLLKYDMNKDMAKEPVDFL